MQEQDQEVVRLRRIIGEGIGRLSGKDDQGNEWMQFEVDYLAEQEPGECCICGKEIESGWLLLDGGEEVCDDHVIYTTERELKKFTRQYIETALWSSIDDNGEPLDGMYSEDDLSKKALQQMEEDCENFLVKNYELVKCDVERAGRDFWLTRNRHGAGFWDGDWDVTLEDGTRDTTIAQKLTKAAHAYGSVDLYVGDNGHIHHS